APPTSQLSTPPLHDALPIFAREPRLPRAVAQHADGRRAGRLIRRRQRTPRIRAHAKQSEVIAGDKLRQQRLREARGAAPPYAQRSEEHTSELQSPYDLVCRL